MGVVYEVSHLVMTKSRFAIKWLLPLDGGGLALRRFQREARICGAIRHPHVVEVYDVNSDDSGSYMVMELLAGESLAERLRRDGALAPHEACALLVKCLAGVAAAHAVGVVHRDLKPANIFLCRRGADDAGEPHPKVLDFGISRVVSRSDAFDTTHTEGTVIGTPAYMPPEQLRALECDARTDVYALGLTLYESLTGQRAFDAGTHADLVVKIVTGDFRPLAQLAPDLPPGLAGVVERAMHRQPERRYESAQAFADALAPYVAAAETTRDGGTATMSRQPKRLRAGFAVLAFALIALAAVGVYLAQQHGSGVESQRSSATHAPEPAPAPPTTARSNDPAPAERTAEPSPSVELPPGPAEPAKARITPPRRPKQPPATTPRRTQPTHSAETPAPEPQAPSQPQPDPAPSAPRPKPTLKLEGL